MIPGGSMRKSFVVMLVIVLIVPMQLFAAEDGKKFDLALRFSPYALQNINYTNGNIPSTRTSEYGLGGGVGFFYNFGAGFAVGVDVSYEFHNFSNFHMYHDLKTDARFRYRFVQSQDKMFRAFVSAGGGIDFVFRDDNDYCTYPLVVGGLLADFMVDKNFSVNVGVDLGCTFQKDSNVFNLTTIIGGTFYFGDNSGKQQAE